MLDISNNNERTAQHLRASFQCQTRIPTRQHINKKVLRKKILRACLVVWAQNPTGFMGLNQHNQNLSPGWFFWLCWPNSINPIGFWAQTTKQALIIQLPKEDQKLSIYMCVRVCVCVTDLEYLPCMNACICISMCIYVCIHALDKL